MESSKESNKPGASLSNTTADGKIKSRLNRKNAKGETSLHIAARKGDVITCERLIEEGIDINQADNAGWTSLHEACAKGFYNIVELFSRHGVAINVKSVDDGETPLHDAVQSGNSKIVWMLLKAGADKNIVNNNGKLAIDMNYKGSAEINWLLSQPTVPPEFPFQSTSQSQETTVRDATVKETKSSAVPSEKAETSDENGSNSEEEESGESRDYSAASSRVGSIYSESQYRGRKRARAGMTNVTPRKPFAATSFQPSSSGAHDVYEFRSSPESDDDLPLQKPIFGENRNQVGAETMDTSEPLPKRHKHVKESKALFEQQGNDRLQHDESDASNHPTEDNSNKKVPPLRILLPKTPSEDDDLQVSNKKPGRSTKTVTSEKKSSDKNEVFTNSQRVTRSKVRQTGVTLGDHDLTNKRKGAWRRGSNASAVSNANASRNAGGNSHQPTPELGENDSSNNTEHEQTVSPQPATLIDEASRSSAGGESDKVVEATEPCSPVLSLFSKSPYESFYELRAMAQNRWLKIIRENVVDEAAIRQMEQFPLTTNYALADNPPRVSYELNTNQSWPEPLIQLAEEQSKHRNELAIAHKAERQRLTLFAEREFLRNMKRSLNIPTKTISAVRILRDAEIYNPLEIESPEEQTSAQSHSRQQLSERLKHLALNLKNRHIAEAQSLLAEQKYDWEKTARKCCSNEKIDTNFIPLVQFEEMNFSFL